MTARFDAVSESETVLILTQLPEDSAVAAEVLSSAGLRAEACDTFENFLAAANLGCGAVVLTENALGPSDIERLRETLDRQEPWSDVPIVLLTASALGDIDDPFAGIGNVSILEKPFSRLTLVRALQVALRARKRQYEVRRLLEAVGISRDHAERANSAKTEFLANMSHEIRTPIGAILGFLDLLKTPGNDASESLNYMGIVERNSHQLLHLIDDILDLSKVEAGKMTVENVRFNLPDLLGDLATVMSFRAGEKGITFEFTLEGVIPEEISTDPVRLRQILGNLVGNAIKFTREGRVLLRARFEEPYVVFTVTDTGVGIPEEQQAKLFRAFAQADTSTTREFGGTGLGLVLSRRLAEALGGDLVLTSSRAGSGSTFTARIRPGATSVLRIDQQRMLEAPVRASTEIAHGPVLAGLRVLLVEDSPDNRMLISTYLRKAGAQLTTAVDGVEGYELATTSHYDVVVMDVQMPRMGGHETARRLRAEHYPQPIVALTAHAMHEERDRCLASGFTEFLTKPVDRDALLDILSKFLPPVAANS